MSDENGISEEKSSNVSDSKLQDAIKTARQSRQDLKRVCDSILNVLRRKARNQLRHPTVNVDDPVVDVAVCFSYLYPSVHIISQSSSNTGPTFTANHRSVRC